MRLRPSSLLQPGLCLSFVCLLLVRNGPKVSSYRTAADEDASPYIAKSHFTRGGDCGHELVDGELYLRVQTTWSTTLIMCGDRPDWTAAAIREFRNEHPELEPYWPDPTRDDGGVAWALKARRR